MKLFDILTGILIEACLLVTFLAVLYRVCGAFLPMPKKVIVRQLCSGVVLRHGKLERVVTPGSYWITPGRTLLACDMRPTAFQLAISQMLTLDGADVRAGLAGEYRVADAGLFVLSSQNAFGNISVELKRALRNAVAETTNRDFAVNRESVANRIKELVIPRASSLGIQLDEVEVVDVFQPVG